MIDPVVALSLFALFAALIGVVFWPGRGPAARLRRMRRFSRRVLLEDALKHVWTCETLGRDCTLESLAGQLELPAGRILDLLQTLAERDLVRSSAAGTELTPAGREAAVRLVRAHRLWERYLADRTGVPAGEWHDEAERMEHTLTHEETERLSARLGHPSWDPHGDPIPTSAGEVPDFEHDNLAGLEPGEGAVVVHLEDEPREIYETLLAEGFAPGLKLEVLERTPRSVTLRADGRTWSTSAVVARNVTVGPLPPGVTVDADDERLSDLRVGETGVVVEISPACQGSQRRRLLDLGMVAGTRVTAELESAWQDPVAYRIRGALVALRREQADRIRIRRRARASDGEAPPAGHVDASPASAPAGVHASSGTGEGAETARAVYRERSS